MSEWSYIIASYALTWIALLGYSAYLHVRLRRAASTLESEFEGTEQT